MPTHLTPVSTTEARVCENDPARTCLIFGNPDSTNIIYVSDLPGVNILGLPISPNMVVVLTKKDGWNVTAAHYAYCTASIGLNVGEGFQLVDVAPGTPPGDGLPHKTDPPM